MNQKLFQQAMQTISARRVQAKAENDQRYQEINKKIPEIAEVNAQLALTALKILKGEDINKLKQRNLQAQQYCAQLLKNHGYPPDYLDIHYTCEKCHDTGYVGNEYCTCLKKLIASAGTAEMASHTQLKLCSFEQFSLEYYKNATNDNGESCYVLMKRLLEHCQKYAANFHAHSPSMLFSGDVGVGKTHLSLSIVTEVIKKGYEVIYDSVGNLFSQIEDEHFGKENKGMNTLQLLLNTDFLVLDDLGSEFQTSFNISVLYTIINTRINKNLPTIISTNLDWKDLKYQYEPRIMSRLYAAYENIIFYGPDIRIKKAKQKSCSPF